MTADRSLMAKARRELEQDAAVHRKRRALQRERLYAEEPRLAELDKRIRHVFLDALSNLSPGAIEAAAKQSLALQEERARLLRAAGAPPEALEETPLCPACQDSGSLNGEPCACLMERYQALQTAELSSLLHRKSFDSFNDGLFSDVVDPDYKISPRKNIKSIREICHNFCRRFGPDSENLFFSGTPGTGKTFLSACVAGVINRRGFSVVYDTAARYLEQMENLHFGRGGEDAEQPVRRLRECDLLIIDDLGAEFITPFGHSALQDLVSTRIATGKKMLVSSNLTRDGLRARYSPALDSRLQGEFLWLEFWGEDLRVNPRR